MGIPWREKVPNTELLLYTQVSGIELLVMKSKLRWVGHMVQMEDLILPGAIFDSKLENKHRNIGGQVK